MECSDSQFQEQMNKYTEEISRLQHQLEQYQFFLLFLERIKNTINYNNTLIQQNNQNKIIKNKEMKIKLN